MQISKFQMEKHVRESFQTAWILAEGQPINARNALEAALIVSRKINSRAFSKLASLLPLSELNSLTPETFLDVDLETLHFDPALAVAYSVSEPFFVAKKVVWGRDFITLSLLADNDSSLNEIANSAGTTVDQLQDAWYEFVTSDDEHRNPEEWKRWWQAAGVPLPPERTSTVGSTYLFTWDAGRYNESEIEKYVQEIASAGSSVMNWSTGARSHVSRGERVFLMRQGVEPLGLVGSGEIEGEVKQELHWDPQDSAQGRQSWIVPVRWDKLSVTPIVTQPDLSQASGEVTLWNTKAGGVKIRPDLVTTLEQLWSQANDGAIVADEYRYAQTLSDLDHKNDWIGVRSDVEALSTLLAVNRVEPPLSIAIFGDWGSGKTFLMRKIQERVLLLEQVGRKQADKTQIDAEQTRYCNSILQIEFNAWHYTESNLWASLVNHIFEKLHAKLTPNDNREQQADTVEQLFEQFEIARAAREVAEKQIELIAAEVTQADAAANSAHDELQNASGNLAEAVGRNVWSSLDMELKNGSKEVSDLRNALKHFGFEESLDSTQTIYETIQSFRSVSGRASQVFGSLLTTRAGLYGALVVALAILIATILAAYYEVPIMSIGTAITAALVWLSERAASARKSLDAIQIFDDWFSKLKQEEESRIAASVAAAQAALNDRQEALSLARQQLTDAKTREARAGADLKQLTARDQMRRFVDERVTTLSYVKHLGIISMIRQDFEDLSDFMYRDRQPGEARLVKRVSTEVQEAIPTVERIVLYIDDLDRCQPERVVEVLEAIHLLLAFRLFIVVVAVDPRWVIESLRQRYPHLSQAKGKTSPSPSTVDIGLRLEATAHDYLEKIFHIPFWVKPIGPNARRSLIEGYLNFSDSKSPEEVKQQAAEQFSDLFPEPSAQHSTIEGLLPISTAEVSPDETTPAPPDYSQQVYIRLENERTAAERKIENVEIVEREEKFLQKLAPYLGNSPRRIKRYANTYRLLKSGLTSQEARFFAASKRASDDDQIVLVFLAVITGAPSLAPQIFSKAFQMRDKFDVDELVKATGLDDPSKDPFETTNAKGSLALLKSSDVTGKKIETWVPRVMRYAFRLTPVSLAGISVPKSDDVV